jgi:hypothetical protein
MLEDALVYRTIILDTFDENEDNRWTPADANHIYGAIIGEKSILFYNVVGVAFVYTIRLKAPIYFYPTKQIKDKVYTKAVFDLYACLTAATSVEWNMGFFASDTPTIEPTADCAHIFFDDSLGNNFICRTYEGAEEQTDSGIVADANYHEFKIVWTLTDVKFYIDTVLVATHTVKVPTGTPLRPLFGQRAEAGTVESYYDWIYVGQEA